MLTPRSPAPPAGIVIELSPAGAQVALWASPQLPLLPAHAALLVSASMKARRNVVSGAFFIVFFSPIFCRPASRFAPVPTGRTRPRRHCSVLRETSGFANLEENRASYVTAHSFL